MNERESHERSVVGERLSRYLDGELNPAETREVERLLETSVEAREMYEMLQQVHSVSTKMMPRTYFSRAAVQAPRRWRLLRIAAALVAVAVLGGLSYAAVQAYEAYVAKTETQQKAIQSATEGASEPARSATSTSPEQHPSTAKQAGASQAAATAAAVGGTNASAPMRLTGVVEDADGNPIANAEIRAVGESEQALRICQIQDVILERVDTDSSGRFSMDWPAKAHGVQIVAPGFATASAAYTGRLYSASIELEARLEKAPTVSGRVTDSDGRPLPGVCVVPAKALDIAHDSVLTDDDGEYTLTTMDHPLLFHHADFAVAILEDFSKHSFRLDVTLNRGGRVNVRVTRGGAPVAGAVVTTDLPLPPGLGYDVTRIADDRGQVTYELFPASESCAFVARTSNGDAAAMTKVAVIPGQGAECLIELPTRYPGLVQGRVIDVDGNPLAKRCVGIHVDSDRTVPDRLVFTEDDGSFRAGLDHGDVRVSVDRTTPSDQLVEGMFWRRLDVSSTKTQFYEEFRYKPAGRTLVALKDRNKQPVTEATMNLLPIFNAYGNGVEFRVRAENGQFEILQSDRVRVWAYDPATRLGGYVEREEPVDRVDVVLGTELGSVVVHVTDPQGNGLECAFVEAMGERSPICRLGDAQENTDEHGFARLDMLDAGRSYTFQVELFGYQLPSETTMPTAVASANPTPIRVVLVPKTSGLAGRVVTLKGSPVENANVNIFNANGGRIAGADTDAEGAFSVANLASGPYVISAYARPFIFSEHISVTAPAEGVELTLPIDALPDRETVEPPEGPESVEAKANLRQMAVVCKVFAKEARGEKYPPLEPSQGVFLPEAKTIYPEHLTDMTLLEGREGTHLCYLGYAVIDDASGLAFLNAYQSLGAEAIYGQDIQVPPGSGTAGGNTIPRLSEELVNTLFGGDANAKADVPLMWEVPGDRAESGGWVAYMDGHTEWLPYPGPFPMTEPFVTRLRQTMGLPALK